MLALLLVFSLACVKFVSAVPNYERQFFRPRVMALTWLAIFCTSLPLPAAVGPGSALWYSSSGQYVNVPGFGTNAPTNTITIEFWCSVQDTALELMLSR